MRDPPHGQKECQQQAIQVRPVHNPTGFNIPATAFAILKRRFHTHAPGIDLHLSASGSLLADEQPRFLTAWVPDKTDVGVQRFLLPDPGCAIPAIATREHDLVKALPRPLEFALERAPTGMLPTHAPEIVPAIRGAELDQRYTC
jgi:hypothetical protein